MALQITQVKSTNGAKRNQRATMESLGLRRIRHTVVHPDIPSVRGMVAVVNHLVNVTEVPDGTELARDASRELSASDAGESGGIGSLEDDLGGVEDAAEVPEAQAPASDDDDADADAADADADDASDEEE